MSSVIASVWFFPDLTELVKVYVITVVVLVTAIINLLFSWERLRRMIVEQVVCEVLRDPDIQKLIDWRLRRNQFRQRLREILKERQRTQKSENNE